MGIDSGMKNTARRLVDGWGGARRLKVAALLADDHESARVMVRWVRLCGYPSTARVMWEALCAVKRYRRTLYV